MAVFLVNDGLILAQLDSESIGGLLFLEDALLVAFGFLLDFRLGNLFDLNEALDFRLFEVKPSLGGVQVCHQPTIFSSKHIRLLLQIILGNSTLL